MSAEYAAQLSRKDRQELPDRQPAGTGPFQLEYRAGQFIRLHSATMGFGAANR